MVKEFEHIKILDNGIVHYDSGLNQFTQEEVDRLNEEYYAHEKSFIPQILEDGYIGFPIFRQWMNLFGLVVCSVPNLFASSVQDLKKSLDWDITFIFQVTKEQGLLWLTNVDRFKLKIITSVRSKSVSSI